MKGRVIALGRVRNQDAAALIEDGRVVDLLIDTDLPRPGTIYRSVVDRPVKGQGGAFVKTPDGSGFLRKTKGISPGQPVLVQTTGYAEPGKAMPVTSRVLFKGRFAIVTPDAPGVNVSRSISDDSRRDALTLLGRDTVLPQGAGLILRSVAADVSDEVVQEDIDRMVDLASAVLSDQEGAPEKLVEGDGPHDLAWRDWPSPDMWADDDQAFEQHGVLDLLDALDDVETRLPTGGTIAVEATRALVAVDVNSGADTSPAMGLKANIAAARELPRQLRLRGLGGQIVIDPAPMPKKDRRAFESALRSAFRQDRVETNLVGWTPLGHYELQRKRDRAPFASKETGQ